MTHDALLASVFLFTQELCKLVSRLAFEHLCLKEVLRNISNVLTGNNTLSVNMESILLLGTGLHRNKKSSYSYKCVKV